jgi:hypothetical protein
MLTINITVRMSYLLTRCGHYTIIRQIVKSANSWTGQPQAPLMWSLRAEGEACPEPGRRAISNLVGDCFGAKSAPRNDGTSADLTCRATLRLPYR